jgi:hypothetical protein
MRREQTKEGDLYGIHIHHTSGNSLYDVRFQQNRTTYLQDCSGGYVLAKLKISGVILETEDEESTGDSSTYFNWTVSNTMLARQRPRQVTLL